MAKFHVIAAIKKYIIWLDCSIKIFVFHQLLLPGKDR